MGLLAALDFFARPEPKSWAFNEVEYRLYSLGEVFPPFAGDRTKSLAGRHILEDFPFKLFSSSTPHESLPQKLCVTFRALLENKVSTGQVFFDGFFHEEIAHEFAAFLSLVTRRRVFVGPLIRQENLPIEEEPRPYLRIPSQERQRLREIKPGFVYELLTKLQAMERSVAEALVLAMRLYHSAVEMMYAEPEFAYLFLVTALETISSVVKHGYQPDIEPYLDARYPGWRGVCGGQSAEAVKELVRVRAG